MYIIFDDDNKKVLGICNDRSKAIVIRNYFDHKYHYSKRNDDSIIIIEAEAIIQEEDAEKWTDVELDDKPLDYMIDIKSDLKPNNWIYREFEQERRLHEEMMQERTAKKQKEMDVFDTTFEQVKRKYLHDLQSMHEELITLARQLKDIHQQVIESKKKYKKGMITEDEFNSISEKEVDCKTQLSKKRRTCTALILKSSNEMTKSMNDHEIHCFVERFSLGDENRKEVLTAMLSNYNMKKTLCVN